MKCHISNDAFLVYLLIEGPMIYQLDELQCIGQGCSKMVFKHPEDENKIIKVMNPNRVDEDGGWKGHGKLKRRMSQGVYRQFRRELLQYLQLCKNHYKNNIFSFPVEMPYGFVKTSVGLGFVTEKIVCPSGEGMTLFELCKSHQFEDKHAKALDDFFQLCCDLHIIFGEVNIAGIMYTEQRNNKPEFVLVDGMGEKLFIPIRAMSKRINAHNVRKTERKIRAQMQQILNLKDELLPLS